MGKSNFTLRVQLRKAKRIIYNHQLQAYVSPIIIPLQTFASYNYYAFGVMYDHGAADREW